MKKTILLGLLFLSAFGYSQDEKTFHTQVIIKDVPEATPNDSVVTIDASGRLRHAPKSAIGGDTNWAKSGDNIYNTNTGTVTANSSGSSLYLGDNNANIYNQNGWGFQITDHVSIGNNGQFYSDASSTNVNGMDGAGLQFSPDSFSLASPNGNGSLFIADGYAGLGVNGLLEISAPEVNFITPTNKMVNGVLIDTAGVNLGTKKLRVLGDMTYTYEAFAMEDTGWFEYIDNTIKFQANNTQAYPPTMRVYYKVDGVDYSDDFIREDIGVNYILTGVIGDVVEIVGMDIVTEMIPKNFELNVPEAPVYYGATKVLYVGESNKVKYGTLPAVVAPTGLEKLTESSQTGWRLVGQDSANYGNIGEKAIDFSMTAFGTDFGATGQYSFCAGLTNKASGQLSSIFGGQVGIASAQFSTIINGTGNTASGHGSIVSGYNNTASSFYETIFGGYAPIVAGTGSTFAATDRLFTIGNGTGVGSRSSAFTLLKNGLLTLPSVNNTLIDGDATGKAVLTKEYGTAKYAPISSIVEYPETSYAPTITWTGTTAPSGTQTGYYIATKVGKKVTVKFTGNYTTGATDVTMAEFLFPAGLPAPAALTNLTSNGSIIAFGNGGFTINGSVFYNTNKTWLKKISSGVYHVLMGTDNLASPDGFNVELSYWTN